MEQNRAQTSKRNGLLSIDSESKTSYGRQGMCPWSKTEPKHQKEMVFSPLIQRARQAMEDRECAHGAK
jgi:hypothetical protein